MRWDKYQKMMSNSEVVFIYDTQRNGKIEGVLRGLPALLYSGFADATCPKSWMQLDNPGRYQLYEYSWHQLQEIDGSRFNLTALTTQYYEDNLTVYSLRTLVNRYSQTANRIFVIGDRKNFQLAGTVRPFREDPVVDNDVAYRDVYSAFEEYYDDHGITLPLQTTDNLFVQDNAILYEIVTGEVISSIEELVDILPEAPYLPILRELSSIFTSAVGIGSEPLESTAAIEEFGKWLRRRVELDYNEALAIARTINDYASSHERLFDPVGRRRIPEINDARRARQNIQPDENPIHARYHTWLSEAL
jgi:hypothetical protein